MPASIWQDSQECKAIQESAHFAKACAQVVQLRRELAAAQEYERLASRATELRRNLAEAPIVATSDPLPAAFSATLGRLLPLGGAGGVALLLTMVAAFRSSIGGGMKGSQGHRLRAPLEQWSLRLWKPRERYLQQAANHPPCKPSLRAAASGRASFREPTSREASKSPSNVLPMRPGYPSTGLPEGASLTAQGRIPEIDISSMSLPLFGSASRRPTALPGRGRTARGIRGLVREQSHKPLSLPKFAAELKALGYDKWKSCGVIRYRGVRFAASRSARASPSTMRSE